MSPTNEGIIFDIQHMSLQDGPGVRTSIFFKGCPLRCQWCHNPESYIPQPQLLYNESRCVGCGACMDVCPNHVHFSENGRHVLNRAACTQCGKCAEVCCYGALETVGRRYSASDLWQEVASDRPYYGERNAHGDCGGVTLTGGEPMLQAAFLRSFLEMKEDTHICMETSGYADPADYQRLAGKIDLFLFDWKATNSEQHLQLTGKRNDLIRQNLDLLLREGARVILRLPMIPGVNDSDEHIQGIAALLHQYPQIDHAEVMAYHRLGIAKTEQLGMAPAKVYLPNATQAQKEEWLSRLARAGAENVILG